jgi:transcription elongation factor Elf1
MSLLRNMLPKNISEICPICGKIRVVQSIQKTWQQSQYNFECGYCHVETSDIIPTGYTEADYFARQVIKPQIPSEKIVISLKSDEWTMSH